VRVATVALSDAAQAVTGVRVKGWEHGGCGRFADTLVAVDDCITKLQNFFRKSALLRAFFY
jgi:hypothetical protein